MKDLSNINCKCCIALPVKPDDFDKVIENGRYLQMDAINKIKSIKLYLLISYVSTGRFFYDIKMETWHRNDLKHILLKDSTDEEFIKYLNERGIVIIECCFCPLHRFYKHKISYDHIPEAVSLCFKRHNLHLLMINNAEAIITLFDRPRILDNEVPEIGSRIIRNFSFHKMERANKRFVKLVNKITDN